MSRTVSDFKDSIIEKTFKWNGTNGEFNFWNAEEEKEVPVDGLTFAILDERFKVTGFSGDEKPIWSNEVKKNTDEITMKSDGKTIHVGTWDKDQDQFKAKNGKYVRVIYAIVFDGMDSMLAKIELKGSALNSWIDFLDAEKLSKGKARYNALFSFDGKSDQKKKGATKYYEPTWAHGELSPDQSSMADEMDKKLQLWFSGDTEPETEEAPNF